jgi:hypothetical protein
MNLEIDNFLSKDLQNKSNNDLNIHGTNSVDYILRKK